MSTSRFNPNYTIQACISDSDFVREELLTLFLYYERPRTGFVISTASCELHLQFSAFITGPGPSALDLVTIRGDYC